MLQFATGCLVIDLTQALQDISFKKDLKFAATLKRWYKLQHLFKNITT